MKNGGPELSPPHQGGINVHPFISVLAISRKASR
ncbi:hypothetical protein SRABI134_03561 [Peribacillus sp. Bi134]|nr:hypothetical protein SRABI134_03561 [Peribacillus sp. Bi134]